MAERALSASVLAAIASGSVRPFLLFEGEYVAGSSTAFLRLFTGVGTLSWDGKEWVGGRDLLSISPIRESTSLEAIGFSVRLSGMPTDKLSVFLQSMRKNKAGRLWLGFMEPEVVDFRFTEATLLAKHGAGVATITFTRAGATATRVNEQGLIETVAADTPRFDYDPVTLECRGLLVEEARTNLCLQSEDFSTTWTNGSTTETVNAVASPDGATTADRIVEVAATTQHYVDQAFSKAASAITYTASVFAKAGERAHLQLLIGNSALSGYALCQADLSAGTVTAGGLGGSGFSAPTSAIEDFGNGWYRVKLTFTSDASTGLRVRFYLGDGSSFTYLGDVTKGLYLWGAQLELGAFPTTYIPTTTTAVTRNADDPRVQDVSGFYNQSEGTIFVEATATFADVSGRPAVSFNDGTGSEVIYLGRVSTGRLIVVDGGSLVANISGGDGVGTSRQVACYRVNDCAVSEDGGAVVADTSVTIPTVTQINLGGQATAPGLWNGHLRRFTYYPRRLPNETLQQLSTPGADDIVWGSSERVITDPYPLRRGRFDMAPISRDPASGTMTIEARYEGPLARLLIPNVRHYTHEDQQLRLAGDKGFDQVEALQDTQDLWGPEVPVFPKTSRTPRPDPSTQTA